MAVLVIRSWQTWGPFWGPRGVPGGPLESPRGTKNASNFLRASLERPGGPVGWFWRSGVILGSVLGGQNVVILLVLDVFLRCYVFKCFFMDI